MTPEITNVNSNDIITSITPSCTIADLESDNSTIKTCAKRPYVQLQSQNNPRAMAAPIPTAASTFAASIFAAADVTFVDVAEVVSAEDVEEGRIVI